MIPPALQQVLLLIESLLRFIEVEYCPPLRVLGVPLFRFPGARTRAAAQLRRLADEIAAIAATLPSRAPDNEPTRAPRTPPLFLAPPAATRATTARPARHLEALPAPIIPPFGTVFRPSPQIEKSVPAHSLKHVQLVAI